jgi:tRNA-specific 2-thiouridylase
MPKPRIAVAMSGGVDSSVVAGILVRRGYDVVGITMQIWQESQTDPRHSGCCSLGAVEDARRVASKLGIPYYVVNMRDEFRERVIENFLDEYAEGRTPNPCVECNRHVKFDLLLDKAAEIGCPLLATGHYARVRKFPSGYRLMRARAKDKDQSYALYMLSQAQLARARFPLGELPSKSETRSIARSLGLAVAQKPDSQEVCFVSEAGGYREFLRSRRPGSVKRGEVVDTAGNIVGEHEGVAGFTVGQRRGVPANSAGSPMYVIELVPAQNRVVVGSNRDLAATEVEFDDVVGHAREGDRLTGKIRYNMPPAKATLVAAKPGRARFDSPVRAVTPGQTAVFYRGECVVAGGTITRPGSRAR